MNTERIKRFVELENEKAALQTKLKAIADEQEKLSNAILEDFVTDEIDSIKLNGRTVFIKETIFAKISSKEEAIKALREAGLDDFITEGYNTNTISAYVREKEKQGEPLPEAFSNAIQVGRRTIVASIRS